MSKSKSEQPELLSEEAVFDAALSLVDERRAELAKKLLDSLEEKIPQDIEEAWIKEAESRLQAYREGKLKAIPAEEVLRTLQADKS